MRVGAASRSVVSTVPPTVLVTQWMVNLLKERNPLIYLAFKLALCCVMLGTQWPCLYGVDSPVPTDDPECAGLAQGSVGSVRAQKWHLTKPGGQGGLPGGVS